MSMNISVIGLGKLGSPLAACLASKGHTVIGVDLDVALVRLLNDGKTPVIEPQLSELIQNYHARLSATERYEDAIANTDVTFIIVPTPSNQEGIFSIDFILQALEPIGQALGTKDSFHLIVITSTVMPGSTGGPIKEMLERSSGKVYGQDFGLCYSPEFIALGSVVRDLLNPDFVLIGESDKRSGDLLSDIYRTLCDNNPPIVRMNFANAELAKISVNTFVTTKISYANMLAEICEKLPGGNVEVVTAALGLDKRIGPKYLKGATGYGGPCFPRDNIAFSRLALMLGVEANIAEATDAINRRQAARLAARVTTRLNKGARVGVLGLAYKPDTNVIEESQGIALVHKLLAEGYVVTVYDPLAMPASRKVFGEQIAYATSAQAGVQGNDAVVITIPSAEFKSIDPEDLGRSDQHKVLLIDCWRLLDMHRFETVCEYVALGIGPTQGESIAVPSSQH